MSDYVGIDLGTTNSAIATFNGSNTTIWKSPEQNDVTPSAIYIDRRGNKYVGQRAYDTASRSPQNSAIKFKRAMGTSTRFHFAAKNIDMTPEQCSAEILKVLHGYLPEDLREKETLGTVITVPAAFNQMQKDATLEAANMAGIGKVALMQEPVAAVMSIMQNNVNDGTYLIYDLGGGTLDIAIAETIDKRVNLLSHGGIAMCGGTDFDRILFDNLVKPWLLQNFNLPDNFTVNPQYQLLRSLAIWATEKAKIELSSREEAMITLSEAEIRVLDQDGEEIYLDIPVTRAQYSNLIEERVMETVEKARETIAQAGMRSEDFENIVFIGGPTNYKPLRDKVSFELGIPGVVNVNPMTAVATGAAIFAESIDWESKDHSRKSRKGLIQNKAALDIDINFIARTPDNHTRVVMKVQSPDCSGYEYQIDNRDNGWTSGRRTLEMKNSQQLELPNMGDNHFVITVFNPTGSIMPLPNAQLMITRTAAAIDAIPASHSIGIAVLDRLNGTESMEWLVRKGDSLPFKGRHVFKAARNLNAGDDGSINFNLYEGEITEPVKDNRNIGTFTVNGSDFDSGIIPIGADLICDYEIMDSGNIVLEVSVPIIGSAFHSDKNFYSRVGGEIDFKEDTEQIQDDCEDVLSRFEDIPEEVQDDSIEQTKKNLNEIMLLEAGEDPEKWQEANETILEAKKKLSEVYRTHLEVIRRTSFNKLKESVTNPNFIHILSDERKNYYQRQLFYLEGLIARNTKEFDQELQELRAATFLDLFKYSDGFAAQLFTDFVQDHYDLHSDAVFTELVRQGNLCLKNHDYQNLRVIIIKLYQNLGDDSSDQAAMMTNILRG